MNASCLVPNRYRKWTCSFVYGLISLSLLGIGLYRYRSPQGAVSSHAPEWACQRALTLASVFGSSVRVVDTPEIVPPNDWSLTCQADDLTIHLCFDDATGRLRNLTTELPPKLSRRMTAPLETAAEAEAVGRHRLSDMQLISADSRFRLTQTPTLIKPSAPMKKNPGWQMVWVAWPEEGAAPVEIRLILDRRTGLPTYCIERKWILRTSRRFAVPIRLHRLDARS